jgi:L-lactate dehydrogenase complex protein LldG
MSRAAQQRRAVLSAVKAALGSGPADPAREAAVAERLSAHARGTIPARAHQDEAALLDLFQSMLESQGAEVTRATTPEAAVEAIAANLRLHNLPLALRLGEDEVLRALPWQSAPDVTLSFGAADGDDRAGLSRAVAAAAETGTLVLASGPHNPTTLAFLPESHTVLIRRGDIVPCYEDAFDRLRAIYGEGRLPRTVNLISGPSRTADIEQTIVRGAHGPKRLHVVVLG